MSDSPTSLNQQELMLEIQNIIISDVGPIWKHIEKHVNIYLNNQRKLFERLANERIEGIISYELFESRLEDIQYSIANFLLQFEIIPYTIVKETSENIVTAIKQKVESHLMALLMPFTYVEPIAY